MKARILFLIFTSFSIHLIYAQCPTQATLEGGGTFSESGTCNISTTGNVEITGDVVLSGGGTFVIEDGAELHIMSGGSLTIVSGTDLDLATGGNDVMVFTGGTMTVAGTITMGNADDFEIEGGSVTVSSSGNIYVDNDLKIYNGGVLTIETGGVVNVNDVFVNDEDPIALSSSTTGTAYIFGTLNVGNVYWEDDTTPASQIIGTGTITVSEALPGSFYVENPANSDCGGCNPCTCSGALLSTPGDISSVILWLRADEGVYEDANTYLAGADAAEDGDAVLSWSDQSGARSNAATSTQLSTPPAYVASGINYQPAIDFDGVDDALDFAGDFIYSSGTGLAVYAVIQPDNDATKTLPYFFDQGAATDEGFGLSFGSDHYHYHSPTTHGGGFYQLTHSAKQSDAQLFGGEFTFGSEQEVRVNGAVVHNVGITLAGLTATQVTTSATHDVSEGPATIGRQSKTEDLSNDGGRLFDGKVAELVVVDAELTALDRQKLESYLALKYAVDLVDSITYVTSDGTTIWPVDSAYGADVVGIIQDETGGLYQKQSKTADDTTRIYLGSLATTNALNTSTISNDLSSVLIGHNDSLMRPSGAGFMEIPSDPQVDARLAREWKVVNTGFTDNFNLDFTLSDFAELSSLDASKISLLVDDDGDFTDATAYQSGEGGITIALNSAVVSISGISNALVSSGATRYITLGFEVDYFITTWQTSSNGDSITIPTTGSGYNYTVYWGDGTETTGVTGDAQHIYATAGTDTVRISGDFPRIYFNNSGDKDKILTVEQWGDIAWASMDAAFRGCTNLSVQASDAPDLSNVTSLGYMFEGCTTLNQSLNSWTVTNVVDMSYMFHDATSFNQPLSSWDVGNVTDMKGMFEGATVFDQDLGNWTFNSSLVSDTTIFVGSGMSCENFSASLIGWASNPSSPTGLTLGADGIAYGINAKPALNRLVDVLGWDLGSVVANDVYCGATENFVTQWAFASADTEIEFNASTSGSVNYSWTSFPSGNSGSGTFSVSGYITLTGLTISAGDTVTLTIEPTNLQRFYMSSSPDVDLLIDVLNWGDASWTSMNRAFIQCANLTMSATDVPDLSNVSDMEYAFAYASSFNGDISSWDVSNVTNMGGLFEGASSFNQDISSWNVSSVTNMRYMFYLAAAFDQPLNSWNVSSVNNMPGMFRGATDFNQPLDSFDVSNVTNMFEMFKDAESFDQPIGSWNMSTVSNISEMFWFADAFNQPLNDWDVSGVGSLFGTFYYATSFDQYLGSWTFSATDATFMLRGSAMSCENYTGTLIGWEQNTTVDSVYLDAYQTYGTDATDARDELVNNRGWTINGDASSGGGCGYFEIDAINDSTRENRSYSSSTPTFSGGTPNGAVTYVLSGTDSAAFTIDSSTGILSMVSRNFESPDDANMDNVYEVTVTATDSDGNSDSETWTVTVTDNSDNPTASITQITINEDETYVFTGSNIGYFDEDGHSFHSFGGRGYTGGGTMTPEFGNSGSISFTPGLNENGSNYAQISFNFRDISNTWATSPSGISNVVTVHVTSVPDAPTAADSTITVTEDSVFTFSDGVFTDHFDDGDGDSYAAFQVAQLPADGTLLYNGSAAVVDTDYTDASLLTYQPAADENGTAYTTFTFRVKDDSGDSGSEYGADNTITVDVTPVNDPPVISTGNVVLNENTVAVTTISVTHPDAGDTLTYGISGTDAADFNINASTGEITFAAGPDFENPRDDDGNNVYEVIISATDSSSLKDSLAITITVSDISETIQFTLTSSSGDESVSSANLAVELNTTIIDDVSVTYTVTGTATGSGTDYTLSNGTINIPAGETADSVTIASIVDDALFENDETVILTLSSPTNATLGTDSVHTYTITDNDNGVSTVNAVLSVTTQGSEPSTNIVYTVTLATANNTGSAITFDIDDLGTGTATSVSDYTAIGVSDQIIVSDGNTTGTYTVSVQDDAIFEGTETVVLGISNASDAAINITTSSASANISDDEGTPTVQFNSSTSSGSESVSSAVIHLGLSTASSSAVSVTYTVTGTATGSGTDYTLSNGTINIPAGETADSVTIASIVDDALFENDETVILTLSSPTNATLGTDSVHTYTITDNDNGVSTVNAVLSVTTQGSEPSTNIVYTVTLATANNTGSAITFDIDDLGTGTATSVSDYTAIGISDQIIVSDGNTTGTYTVSVQDDAIFEGTETVVLGISNASDAAINITTSSASANISDDEGTPTVQFNSSASSGSESVSSAVIHLGLSTASSSAVSVTYTVTGTATGSGTDYTLSNGTINIPAGETADSVTIASIVDDALFENDETVILTLSSPTNATLGTNLVHTYTITDNDNGVSTVNAVLSVTTQGSEPSTNIVYTVTLATANNTGSAITFDIDDLGTGTATSVSDYTAIGVSDQIIVSDGNTTGTYTVSVQDDAIFEGTETVVLGISNASDAAINITTSSASANISDDEGTPTVQFNSSASSGSESVSSAVIRLGLSTASSSAVSVTYTVTGTATGSGTDYTLSNGTINIPAGETADSVTIASIVDDALFENDETVILTLSSPTNATLGTNFVHTYTITDNDNGVSTVNAVLSVTTQGSEPSTNIVYTVTLATANNTGSAITFDIDDLGTGTATSVSDYTAIGVSDQIIVSDGNTTGTYTVSVQDDAIFEGTETVVLGISNASDAAINITTSSASANISDDEGTPTVQFNSSTSSGSESVSSAVIRLGLSTASSSAVSVTYTVTGTATGSGTDYTLSNGTINIPAGETADSVTIASIVDDALFENDETVILTLSSPTNATLGTDSVHTYTITDNDNGVSTVNAVLSVTTQGSEPSTNIVYTVTLATANNTGSAITFDIDDLGTGTATSVSDYTAIGISDQIIVSDGNTTGTYTVSVQDDAIFEGTETVVLGISNASDAAINITTSSASANISDDEGTPTVQFNSSASSGSESVSSAVIRLGLSTASSSAVSVTYTVTGTATGSGTDYTLSNGTINIPAGETADSVTIASIVDDALFENDETVILTLSSPTNATLGTDSVHTYTITDNDNGVSTVNAVLSVTTQGSEPSTNIVYTVTLATANNTGSAITFDIDDLGTGTATSVSDYTAIGISDQIIVSDGNTTGTYTVSVQDDAIFEGTETVVLGISNASDAAINITTSSASANISDDEGTPTVQFNSSASSGSESVSSAVIRLGLSTASSSAVSVTYTVTGTATGSGTDYTLSNGTINIPAGETADSVTIASIVDDALFENDETVILTLSSPTNATLGTNLVHTYTITDNDNGVSTVNAVLSVTTQGSEPSTNIVYTVTLATANNTGSAITFDIDDLGTGTATSVSDYTAIGVSDQIIVSDGNTTGTYTVSVQDDAIFEGTETVVLGISNASDAAINITTSSASANISDDEGTPTVQFNSSTSSGSESVSSAVIHLGLSTASSSAVSVTYTVTGTATGSGTDYTLSNGTINIPAGETADSVTIASIVDDALFENDETVILTLSSPTNATLGTDSVHTYTITDNDNGVSTVNAVLSVTTQGSEPSTNIVYTVTLATANNTGSAITFDIDDLGTGTATSVSDYTAIGVSDQIIVSDGNTTGTYTVSVQDDAIFEGTETVVLGISNASDAAINITTSSASANISDDEGTPTVQFNSSTSSGSESVSSAVIRLGLSTASSSAVSVTYTVTGTATGSGTDYTLSNGTINIPAGETADSVTIASIVDDALFENDETVILTLSSPTNATLGTNFVHTYTITDNDNGVSTVNAVLSVTTQGSEPSTNIVYTVTLATANNTGSAITFDIDDLGTGTATSVSDYTAIGVSDQIIVSDGNTTGTYTVSVQDDAIFEGTETVVLGISNASDAAINITTSSASANISDDEGTPTVQFNSSTSSGSESVSSAVIRLGLSTASSSAVSVTYTVTGTATGSGTDYTLSNGTINIPAGETADSVTIASIVDDALFENDETVILTLSSPTNATLGTNFVHTYTITDNDNGVSTVNAVLSVTTQGSEPSTNIVYTVTLATANNTGSAITFDIDDLGTGTATSVSDYTAIGVSDQIIVSDGNTTGTYTVSVQDDAIFEEQRRLFWASRMPRMQRSILLLLQPVLISVTMKVHLLYSSIVRHPQGQRV